MGSVNVCGSIALGGKHNPVAIPRERSIVVQVRVREQRSWMAAIGLGYKDIRIERGKAGKGDGVTRFGRRALGAARSIDGQTEDKRDEKSTLFSLHNMASVYVLSVHKLRRR